MSKRRDGWERMKAANEKKSRVNEALQSTPKLCTYVASKSNVPSTSDIMSTSETITSTTVAVADSADQQRDNSRHHLIVEGADTDTAELQTELAQSAEPSIGSQQPPNQDYQAADTAAETGATTTATSMFSNDPGFWESISETMRSHWVQLGPVNCRNIDTDFDLSVREYPKQKRYYLCLKELRQTVRL